MIYHTVTRIVHISGIIAILTLVSTAGFATDANNTENGQIDVLNFWTSGSEARSMHILQKMLANRGITMNNDAVSGGGGANMRTVLKSRIQSHSTPGAAHLKSPSIQQWCKTGLIGNIDAVAKAQHWQKILAPRIAKNMQCGGHYVAVPFNIHRLNWLWINRSLLEQAGATIPHSWKDFVDMLKKLDQAGITPIAGGGNSWQVGVEFGSIVAATGDAKFYRDAFVKLEPKALSSPTMVKAFKRLRTIEKYTDRNAQGLTWNHDTQMVVHGKAAIQIMGDWAKGEITNDGKTPGKEVDCVVMPGSEPIFVYTVDSFEFFKVNSQAKQNGQKAFARTVMTPKFQRLFNKAKGSIPVREGVSHKGFDACAEKSVKDYIKAKKNDALVPSMSVDNAEISAVKGAITDVLARFYNNSQMSPNKAAEQLAARIKQAQQMSKL